MSEIQLNGMQSNWYARNAVVGSEQCGADGIMRPDAWFQLFQWISGEHCDELLCGASADLPSNIVWILLSISVEWQSDAHAGDALTMTTSPAPTSHGMYQRHINIIGADGRLAASSVANWTLMDLDTRRITRYDVIQQRHSTSESAKRVRIPMFDPLHAPHIPWEYTPTASDIDKNGHVNNACYIAWLCAALAANPSEPVRLASLDAWYSSEIMPSERVTGRLAREGARFSFEIFHEDSPKDTKPAFAASGVMRV